VVWSEGGEMFHQKICLDLSFVDSAMSSIVPFIKYAVLPELVGKYFSKQTVADGNSSSSHNNNNDVVDASSSTSDAGYCYCKKEQDFDDMISCDNKDCPILDGSTIHA